MDMSSQPNDTDNSTMYIAYINTLGVDILLYIISGFMFLGALLLIGKDILHTRTIMLKGEKSWRVFVSSSFNLFLLLMSYTFSHVEQQKNPDSHADQQKNSEARIQLILTWMVLAEIIRQQMNTTSIGKLLRVTTPAEKLFAMLEQLGRICGVGYLVYRHAPIQELKINLFALCVASFAYEIVNYVAFLKAKNSYLVGKNVELIGTYVKRVVLEDDLQTSPLDCCDYIVLGEKIKQKDLSHNGYQVDRKKSGPEGLLTIRKVLQLKSDHKDDAFAAQHPRWDDTCLSFALAKMLMRRFAMLPLDEAESGKALDFVLVWLNGYIGKGGDPPKEENSRVISRFAICIRNLVFPPKVPPKDVSPKNVPPTNVPPKHVPPKDEQEKNNKKSSVSNLKEEKKSTGSERVFHILKEELKFVSRFLHSKLLMYQLLEWVYVVDVAFGFFLSGALISFLCQIGLNTSLNFTVMVKSLHGSSFQLVLNCIDWCIIFALFTACLCLQEAEYSAWYWRDVHLISNYVKNPRQWKKPKIDWSYIVRSFTIVSEGLLMSYNYLRDHKPKKSTDSVFDIKARKVSGCINLKCLPKGIRRLIRQVGQIEITPDVKEAVLTSLIKSRGKLTNGVSSLRDHKIEHLNWACRPNGSTTDAILVWHIATTLFGHKNPPNQGNDSFQKNRGVASTLSNYCHYLVATLPELLPDDDEWTEKVYQDLKEEILCVHNCSSRQLGSIRCDRVLLKSPQRKEHADQGVLGDGVRLAKDLMEHAGQRVLGDGVRLAKELMENAGDQANVWGMLADFWAEMMLFIAPSHNIEVHEQVLETDEFITQIWALLTHAGILTRPKTSGSGDNDV